MAQYNTPIGVYRFLVSFIFYLKFILKSIPYFVILSTSNFYEDIRQWA